MANTILKEMQFELLPTEDFGGEGFAFGIGRDLSVNSDGFNPGDREIINQDAVNPTRGATLFGRDMTAASNWTWSCHTDMDDVEGALEALDVASYAWGGLEVAQIPGAVTTLRYRVGNRVRRIYGRPRRFVAPPNNLILSGMVPVTMDFKRSDHLHYSDDLDMVSMPLSTDSDGGFILPATMPIHTLAPSERSGNGTVGGTHHTYPVVRFDGPVGGPMLVTNDWTLKLDMSIPDGEYVEVDLRPWHLTVLKNGNQGVSGALARRTRMADMYLTPGSQQFDFAGSGSGINSLCTVSWRSAWNSL